jgi:nucleotide-binding universal stress UspA family protein
MAIKTLLVHLAPDPDWEPRLAAAVGMAQTLGAHLVALYVAAPVHLPPGAQGRGASALYLHEAREEARSRTAAVRSAVAAACEAVGVTHEWHEGGADHLDSLLEIVHHVDLTVLNQVSFDHFEDRLMFQLPEHLVIGAGGPVLVLPKGHSAIDLDRIGTVLIAWTYSKEAIRALRDSLPILAKARAVTLFTCGDAPKEDTDPAEAVLAYLARHGIHATLAGSSLSGHAGEEILQMAEGIKAELIVMGAYGHTSMLDKLFGSASRYVIGHTKVPLFMSH